MAIKKIRKKTVTKKGKKKWHKIQAPALFGGAQLGESYVYTPEDLVGKYLTANLSTITKNMRKQTANVKFRVHKLEEGVGLTEVVGYHMINAAVKRLVRRGRDKVADSFICKTKSKKIMRIKPLIITANHTTKMIQSACRLEARRIVKDFVFSKDIEEVIDAIVNGRLQKIIKEKVIKIFPVKTVEIRMANLEENNKVVVTDKEVQHDEIRQRKITKNTEGTKWKEEKQVSDEVEQALDIPEDVELTDEDDSEDFGDEEETDDSEEETKDSDEEPSEEEPKKDSEEE